MSSNRLAPLLGAILLVLAACGTSGSDANPGGDQLPQGPPPPPLSAVLPHIPQPPESNPVHAESGADATMLTFLSTLGADSIVEFYRDVLTTQPFRLLSEQKVDGQTIFVAEQDGPSLWVTVTQLQDSSGTLVGIAGGSDLRKQVAEDSTP